MNYRQVSKYLDDCLIFGIKPSLVRIKKLLEVMGNPHRKSDSIHVVGTNGKTSTTIILAHILYHHGVPAAYHISPHISGYTERIWINGSQVSAELFTEVFNQIHPYIDEVNHMGLGGSMTQFEIIAGLAFKLARIRGVRVMVLEAGMGGRWDATNAADSVVAGLTGVSLEHTEILGSTIAEIAAEKVEVIKKDSRVATISRDPRVLEIIKKKVGQTCSEVFFYPDDFKILRQESMGLGGWAMDIKGIYNTYYGLEIHLPGDYQVLNTALAVALAELYLDRLGKEIETKKLSKALALVCIKGRFEILQKDPLVVSDASHNPEGMDKFMDNLKQYFPGKRIIVIFAVLKDKDYRKMIENVLQAGQVLILTSSGTGRSLETGILAGEVKAIMGRGAVNRKFPQEVYTIDSVENSLKFALKISDSNDIICITGSITNLERLEGIY